MSAHYWKTISLCSSYCITYFSNQYSSKKHYWFLLFNAYLINFNDDIVFNIHVCKLHYIERTHFILDMAKVCITNIGRFNLLHFIYSLHLNQRYIINIWWHSTKPAKYIVHQKYIWNFILTILLPWHALPLSLYVSLNVSPITTIVRCHLMFVLLLYFLR